MSVIDVPRFRGTVQTMAGFNQGRIRYTEALLLLGEVNRKHFRKSPVQCTVEYSESPEQQEMLTFDYRNNRNAAAELVAYMVQKGISFKHDTASNN